jgi:hypothetical protein
VNGGFEGVQAQTQPEWFYAGSDMGGWLVGGQVGDHVSLNWDPSNAKDGNQYLVMAQSYAGDISQALDLHTGSQYALQFYVFGTTDQYQYPQSFQVDVVSYYPADTLQNSRAIASPSFPVTYVSSSTFGYRANWMTYQTSFTALAEQERLLFRFGPSSTNWFAIDGISLVEISVPEPSLFGLFLMVYCTVCGRRFMRPRV